MTTADKALLKSEGRPQGNGHGNPRPEPVAVWPLSFAQQRLWFLDQLEPNSPVYNIPVLVRIRGEVRPQALQQALDVVVARHESLRTRFVNTEGEPGQIIVDSLSIPIRHLDLSQYVDGERDARAREALSADVLQPFSLESAPLLRVTLIRLSADEHLLLTNIHHIIADEWSLKVFFRELTVAYEAFHSGGSPVLPELPIQYGDYAVWQRSPASLSQLDSQMTFWRRHLAGTLPATGLVTDHPRPAGLTCAGALIARPLSKSFASQLKAFAASQGATPYMVLLAAFQALVHRYTGQDDVIIGTPVAGRQHVQTEPLIGFFVNTLPVRANLTGQLTFRQLLTQTRTITLDILRNQDVPLERLVEEFKPDRSLGHMPFTRLMFLMQQAAPDRLQWPGATVYFEDFDTATAKFDLTLSLRDSENGLVAKVEYNTQLFQPGTIQRLLEHYENMLRSALADPDQPIARLNLLAEEERRKILLEWNDTARPYPGATPIHQLFEAQAARTPDAIAVLFEGQSITYGELNARANQLAQYLIAEKVGPEVPVGLCCRRSIEMIVGTLAILKAGGAYVPLDPNFPRERLAFLIEDAHVSILLTQQKLLAYVPHQLAKVICLDADWELISRESRQNPVSSVTAANLAYIMYTSGSTGVPKGVAVKHQNVTRLVLNTNYVELNQDTRLLHVSNITFDAATYELWGALLNGGRVVIMTRDVSLSPRDFAREIQAHGVTDLFLTTALFNQVAAEAPWAFAGLKSVSTGGETMDIRAVSNVLTHGAPRRLMNVYGPTENTTFSCFHEVSELPANTASIPIGRPIANTRVYILDGCLQPVPIGVPGELYTGGDGVARGYWNRPELTRDKFVPDPFLPKGSSGLLYRTGDLARFRADGAIEFLGRADNQVKIRGFRIELGEVETMLTRHPGVSQAAVAVWGKSANSKKLVAYLVPSSTRHPNASELRQFLREKLPDYMVPSTFVVLDSFPLLPSGKVDRKALPPPDQGRPDLEKVYVAPRNPTEQQLATIWEEVLGVKPVGVHDKFFDLGGHSLLAVKLLARIEQAFGRRLRLVTIFQAPTIEQLALILREELKESHVITHTSVVEIQSQGRRPPLFLVHGAGGGMFWGYANLAKHLGPGQPVYAFRPRGADGRDELPGIQAMAAHYIDDLRQIQPHGPYFLGGYCFGGNVAYEMARQLDAAGERVALLALLNCAPPNSSYSQPSLSANWLLKFLRNLVYWGGYFAHWTPSQRREFFRWKFSVAGRRLSQIFHPGPAGGATVDVGNIVDLAVFSTEERRLWEVHIRALLDYRPGHYHGPVHLFRSPGHPIMCSFEADHGWGRLADSVTVTQVPGAHEKILEEPCVRILARELELALTVAQGEPSASRSDVSQPSRAAVWTGVTLQAALVALGAIEQIGLAEHPLEAGTLSLGMTLQNLAVVYGGRKKGGTKKSGSQSGSDSTRSEPDAAPGSNGSPIQPVPEPGESLEIIQEELSAPAVLEFQELSRSEKLPLPVTLLAAFKAFLKRFARPGDSDSFLLLSPTQADGNGCILDCAVNPIISETTLTGEMTFRQFLRTLGPVEPAVANPAVDQVPCLKLRLRVDNHRAGGTFDVELDLDVQPAVRFRLGVNPNRFTTQSAQQFLSQIKTCLEELAAQPDVQVSKIPLLNRVERKALLVDWNQTNDAFVARGAYPHYFQQQVARTPDAIAVQADSGRLTYAELNSRANQLAHRLIARGVQPETIVAVCLPRSVELMVSLLAIWKAGGAYLPLDPEYPAERLNYMLQDSRTPVLITGARPPADLELGNLQIINLENAEERALINAAPTQNPEPRAGSDSLAYIIYTSGSTGAPKGVEIPHRSLLNHNQAVADAYRLEASDRVLQFTAISFDISVEEIFPTWMLGAMLVLRQEDASSSVDRFLDQVDREKISVLNLPTAFWHQLVEVLSRRPLPESVRLVVIGGEKASDASFRRWKSRVNPNVQLINSYGPTETTVTATLYTAQPGDESLVIGKPIANTQVVILDENLQPVPPGIAGHLHIGGAGLARGYLNRPDLTRQKFIPNPLPSEIPSERLYATGDVARYRADGNIEFLGRLDHQVKIRGFRIELGEIETALLAHPMIRDAAVVAREDDPGDKRLVAYLLFREGPKPRVGELLKFLRAKLPAYMVPAAFVVLTSFPMTPAGKVDRRALPRPGRERPDLDSEWVAPSTPLEQALAQTWKEVLGFSEVGIKDSFFDLGGHSLLATQVVSRIREQFGVELPLSAFFSHPTIVSLAEELARNPGMRMPVAPGCHQKLSPRQQRIWFLDQFDPRKSPYNRGVCIRLKGDINSEALEQSIRYVMQRHPMLRSIFPLVDGTPMQVTLESADFRLVREDVTSRDGAKADEIVKTYVAEPHVTTQPALKAMLLKVDDLEHVLVIVIHEIACDARSRRRVVGEIATVYQALATGQNLEEPGEESAPAYEVDPRALSAQLNYWKQQLAGAPPVLPLPTDFPRPAVLGDAGARVPFALPSGLISAAQELATRLGTGLDTILLGTFELLLHRYTGSHDLVVGRPMLGSACSEQSYVGPMETVVALRSRIAGSESYEDFLRQVAKTGAEAARNADIHFAQVAEELHPTRQANHTAIFQVLFECEHVPARAGNRVPSWELQEIDGGTSRFDLSFHAAVAGSTIEGWIEFSTELFRTDRIERLLQHYLTLLESGLRKPQTDVGSLELLPKTELDQVLVGFNSRTLPYERTKTALDLILDQAARTPDGEALVYGAQRITYRQLLERSRAIARELHKRGVTPQSLVAICLERSAEMVAALVGAWMAGAAYVPLDPAYPESRLLFILRDSGARVLVSQRAFSGKFPEQDAAVMFIEDVTDHDCPLDLLVGPRPEDLSHVIYTSGSTGQPKGVALEHRNLVPFIAWAREQFSAGELSGVLASTSICFDLSVFEIFATLACGGKVILAQNALALGQLPARCEVTLINTVPSAMRELLRMRAVPPSVRVVNLAGEPLSAELADQVYRETPAEKLYDLYGPTETTIYSTCALRVVGERPSIGRPLPNESVLVLDSRMQPVPIGVPGELHIGGAGVARAYLNRPELTAGRFVANPFRPEERLYKTGDLARWQPDGTLEYLGRIDNQVKIRGFRIELGEIEAVVQELAGTTEVAAMVREDHPGDQRIVAYVAGLKSPVASLMSSLKERLPEYMVPAHVVSLEGLPLTPNGKVDRKALPSPTSELDGTTRERQVSPRTPLEAQLVAIWRETLRVKELGVHDNFFQLGGHSLLAIQTLSRIRDVMHVELPIYSLFDAPTVAALAEGMESARWGNEMPTVPLQKRQGDEPPPLSFVQERLWFLDQLEPGSDAYNVPAALRLEGRLDREALAAALQFLSKRHEALRTSLTYVDGKLVQAINPETRLDLEIAATDGVAGKDLEELVTREARRPFNLAAGPLIRASLFPVAPEEHLLLLVMHHSISDGWSIAILFQELAAVYNRLSAGLDTPDLPELPVQYGDFAVWQRATMHGVVLERQLTYWRNQLKDAPPSIDLPADSTPDMAKREAGREACDIRAGKLTESCQREGVTPFMILIGGLSLTLGKWTGQQDLVIGTVIAGRNRREVENVIGCFMNFLPVRTKLHGVRDGRDLLGRVRQSVLDGQAHQDCPFEKIVEAINPQRRSDQNPLYNVALLLQNFPAELFQAEGISATPVPVTMSKPLLDLRFEVEHIEGGLRVTCEYRTDLFSAETIRAVLGSLSRMVGLLVERPEVALKDIEPDAVLVGHGVRERVAIAATFTAEPVWEPLFHWMKELGEGGGVEFAGYNQVFQSLLDANSVLGTGSGVNVILLRLEDLREQSGGNGDGGNWFGGMPGRLVEALRLAAGRWQGAWLVILCPPSQRVASDAVLMGQHEEVWRSMASELAGVNGVYATGWREVLELYPVTKWLDPTAEELGAVPYTPEFFTALATVIARRYRAVRSAAPKVIVLDCDQTLWSGVCGEDGPKGIRPEGPWRELQEFMARQREAGRLLCLCSKNNAEDVEGVFAQWKEMPLRRGDFAACRLNWLPKSENLRSLARELNVGLDSFVFIDDNPVECAEVEAACPEVLTLQLPEEPERFGQFLKHCWALDVLKVTAEDRRRGEMYVQNREREALRASSQTLADFINHLDLRIEIGPVEEGDVARVSQLTLRTNQFNTTTRRRSEGEVAALRAGHDLLKVQVRDRFGDYGLVGVMICRTQERALRVDTFLLSCRVLGRGVEHGMLARLGELAKERGLQWVEVEFGRTAKNKPAWDFLEGIGAPFRQPGHEEIYRFPTGFAEEVAFNPQGLDAVEPRPLGGGQGTAAAGAGVRKFERCRFIALEADDVGKIQQLFAGRRGVRVVRHMGYVAPQSALERQLCELWQGLLGVDRVGIDDDFFELGGHSLLAVRLFAEVERLTGRKFPLITLFQAPTVGQLARLLSEQAERGAGSLLVPIQPRGTGRPLFLVHGAGGDVLWGYANLAAHLKGDRPVYGIKSRGQAGQEEFGNIVEMAAHYVSLVRGFQREGPYYVGGYCFGGNVAYEMARQLRAAGQEVALVALLDSSPANAGYERMRWWRPAFGYRFARNLYYWMQDFAGVPAAERRRFFTRKGRAMLRKLGRLFGRGVAGEVDVEEVIDPTHFPEHELKLWKAHLQALTDHADGEYEGEVLLLRTRGQPLFCSFEEDFCWTRLVRGGVKVELIPGSHENIFMEPNVQALAEVLERWMGDGEAVRR